MPKWKSLRRNFCFKIYKNLHRNRMMSYSWGYKTFNKLNVWWFTQRLKRLLFRDMFTEKFIPTLKLLFSAWHWSITYVLFSMYYTGNELIHWSAIMRLFLFIKKYPQKAHESFPNMRNSHDQHDFNQIGLINRFGIIKEGNLLDDCHMIFKWWIIQIFRILNRKFDNCKQIPFEIFVVNTI